MSLNQVEWALKKLALKKLMQCKHSYFNWIVEMWKSLPLEIRLAPNLEAFKSNVKKNSNIKLKGWVE